MHRKLVCLAVLAAVVVPPDCPACHAQEAASGVGTIQGTVDSPYVRLSEAVVYIESAPGKFQPPEKNPVMDQKNLVFIPHVLPVLVGTTVDFPNNDTVRHNVFSPPSSVEPFNLGTYAVGVTKQHTFNKPGVVPLLCNVHAEMSAFIVVCPTPYFAATDKRSGAFTIKNVPPGKYKLVVWHERLRSATKGVTVSAGKTTEVTFSGLRRKR